MNLSTSKQQRNIQTARKHRRHSSERASRRLAEQIAAKCSCPDCRAKRGEMPGVRSGTA